MKIEEKKYINVTSEKVPEIDNDEIEKALSQLVGMLL